MKNFMFIIALAMTSCGPMDLEVKNGEAAGDTRRGRNPSYEPYSPESTGGRTNLPSRKKPSKEDAGTVESEETTYPEELPISSEPVPPENEEVQEGVQEDVQGPEQEQESEGEEPQVAFTASMTPTSARFVQVASFQIAANKPISEVRCSIADIEQLCRQIDINGQTVSIVTDYVAPWSTWAIMVSLVSDQGEYIELTHNFKVEPLVEESSYLYDVYKLDRNTSVKLTVIFNGNAPYSVAEDVCNMQEYAGTSNTEARKWRVPTAEELQNFGLYGAHNYYRTNANVWINGGNMFNMKNGEVQIGQGHNQIICVF